MLSHPEWVIPKKFTVSPASPVPGGINPRGSDRIITRVFKGLISRDAYY